MTAIAGPQDQTVLFFRGHDAGEQRALSHDGFRRTKCPHEFACSRVMCAHATSGRTENLQRNEDRSCPCSAGLLSDEVPASQARAYVCCNAPPMEVTSRLVHRAVTKGLDAGAGAKPFLD